MREVVRGEPGWDDETPDPTYVDPDAPQLAASVFPVAGQADVELEADRLETEQTALERAEAAAKGEEDLDDTDIPPYTPEGHMLLGFDDEEQPVYETDEERDERVAAAAVTEVPETAEIGETPPDAKPAKKKK